jgi:hypothetical protein
VVGVVVHLEAARVGHHRRGPVGRAVEQLGELLPSGSRARHGVQRAGTLGFDGLDVDVAVADDQVRATTAVRQIAGQLAGEALDT